MEYLFLFFFIILSFSFINSIKLVDNDFFEIDIKNLVRKINRLSISSKNEVMMNILLERLSNYIKNNDIKEERKESPKEKYKDILYVRGNFTENIDGTYDIYSHETIEFDRGYQVSFETAYDDYTKEDYEEIVYKMALMSDNQVYLGVYGGNIEFSFHFDDLDLATTLGILYKQISIWDWSLNEEISNQYCPYT